MNDRIALELDDLKRLVASLNARLHAIEALAPAPFAGEITPAIELVSDINTRVHKLEAKVTELQLYSLGRPSAGGNP